jgi:SAM-dependent methyltransferase
VTSGELAPPGVDITRPSIARVYDYMIGGKDNFAVDRAAAEAAMKITPDGGQAGRASRAFLRRVVRYLAATEHIDQFLDIGSGLPTQGNVHEIAQLANPAARVVYVDNDPMALAHGRALLADAERTIVVQGDAREPAALLADPQVTKALDFSRPIGLLMLGILHHVNDTEDPLSIAERFRSALVPGSFLAIDHFHDPGEAHPDISRRARAVEKVFNETMGTGRWRRYDEILAYFGDFELVDPGLVPVCEWRLDPEERFAQTDTYYTLIGGVARKR